MKNAGAKKRAEEGCEQRPGNGPTIIGGSPRKHINWTSAFKVLNQQILAA
ncbi:MAG: hypothetical protein IIB54_12720 [Planctomycetes bacterium]|nr:hypothetical protein [Planctomycetota bacterium]